MTNNALNLPYDLELSFIVRVDTTEGDYISEVRKRLMIQIDRWEREEREAKEKKQ